MSYDFVKTVKQSELQNLIFYVTGAGQRLQTGSPVLSLNPLLMLDSIGHRTFLLDSRTSEQGSSPAASPSPRI